MKTKTSFLLDRFIGKAADFSLEGRIFHSICLVVIMGIGLNIPYNIFSGNAQLAKLMPIVLISMAGIYFNSRVKRRVKFSIMIFQIVNSLLLIVNYYFDSGIDGSTILIFILSLFIMVAIAPTTQYFFWFLLNISLVIGLLCVENAYPQLIVSSFHDRASRLVDFGYTYVIIAILVLFITIFIRRAYHTERRLARQKTRDLAESNETKNKLLSILAHDLKEPLASIQSFLELTQVLQLQDADRISIEKELLYRTQHVSYMLANMLSWTKTQMSGVSPHLWPLKVSQSLESTLELLTGIAAGKNISIRHIIASELYVLGDIDMLQMIIHNLIINAIKFTSPGGKIEIYAELQGDQCVIAVKDDGNGIPEEKQPAIFSLGATSTYGTGKEKGIGLGLVLCRNFIELQGGSIWFISAKNEGSTFFISLPGYISKTEDIVQPTMIQAI